nr:M48 family metalloprotease [Alsobacter ponti]
MFPDPTVRPLRRLLAACGVALALAGCASDHVGVGTLRGKAPAGAPRVAGVDTPGSRDHRNLVSMFGGEYRYGQAERMLNDVMARLTAASERPDQSYRVTILNSPAVNAFALPNGNLYVTRGLLALANDTSEIAAVMAHEVAHVSANHAVARAELQRRAELVSRVVAEVLEDPAAGQAAQATGQFNLASFSRAQELEADQIGVRTLAKAGFDPFGAARFLGSLGRQAAMRSALLGEKPSQQSMNFLSTHPSTPERVAQALAAARAIGGPGLGESDRGRYLAAIDGITYGDDPAEGMVRGTRFLHPHLGFTFTAPPGFVLENSAVAVVGLAPGGAQALRFDSVKLPDDTTLEAYLSSGWIEGVKVSPPESLEPEGLDGLTTVARGDDWTFRLAAIRSGAAVYRFILAARTLTPEVDRQFRRSIASFRTLTAQEIASIRPLRVALASAKPGDTPETMGGRMAIPDHPVERFMALNGLERNAAIRPGQTYKIVVE